MKLRTDEKAMLDGAEGRAVQVAMDLLVRYGDALGAEEFIDTNNVCGYLFPREAEVLRHPSKDLKATIAQMYLDSDEPLEFPKVKVQSLQVETHMDPEYYELIGKTKSAQELYYENEKLMASMGVQLTCTCTPYQLGNLPMKGEHCAWMESSAVAFINGALGARTNCEGNMSAFASMLTGKTPYWGYHIPENRLGTHLIEVETDIDNFEDWGLLGYYVGKTVIDKVPVINGIKRIPLKDELKQFGAAAASSGGIEMYHVVGVTPEARTLEEAFGANKPVEVLRFGAEEKRQAYEQLNCTGKSKDVDFVMLGCPHYSLEQIREVCSLLNGRKIKDGMSFWIYTAKAIKEVAKLSGYLEILEKAGAVLMCNTCPCLGGFQPRGAKVMASDSGKQSHYLPNFTGIQSWYGSTAQCVEAAVSGKWEGMYR